jgi:hypothetical protein
MRSVLRDDERADREGHRVQQIDRLRGHQPVPVAVSVALVTLTVPPPLTVALEANAAPCRKTGVPALSHKPRCVYVPAGMPVKLTVPASAQAPPEAAE